MRLIQLQLDAPPEPLLFVGLAGKRVPRVAMLIGSVASHILMVILITAASRQMAAWFQEEQLDWSHYRVEPLRLHLGEPLFFRATAVEERPARHPAARSTKQVEGSRAAAHGPRSPSSPHNVELPTPPEAARNAPIILQPDFRPQMVAPDALPPLAFWARQGANLPKPPAPGQVVVPGRTEQPAPAPKLASRPVLAVPNREQSVADVNVSLPQAQTQKPPVLPLANSATIPVRIRTAKETQTASFEVSSGESANILAMAAEYRNIRDVRIPRGLQNIPLSTDDAGGLAAGENDSGAKAANAGANGTSASAGAGSGNPRGGSAANATANSTSTARVNSPGSPSAAPPPPRDTGIHSGGGGPMIAAVAALPGSRPEKTRLDHPANGSFDVVIMQSAARDDLPDVGGILSGNPVYTVYLPVGDRKEWLLEYCAPASERVQANTYQISLEDTTPITPPYPISTTIPNSILSQGVTKHIVLHGFLTARGNLQNMKVPEASNPLAIQILALLGEWQFRPALRNKKPIDLEILLVIPARS